MFAHDLAQARRHLDAAVRALDVDRLAPADAAALMPDVVALRNQSVAALALLTARAADAAPSDRDAARRLAEQSGDTFREAKATLDTGIAVRRTEATRTALQAGELSPGTAHAIARAASQAPGVERDLLDRARSGAAAEDVRRQANRERAKARDETEDERQARLHRKRRLTTWEDDEGATQARLSSTPLQWGPIAATLEPYQDAAFRRGRRTGEHAGRAAYAMDGLALMAHVAAGGDPGDLGYEDIDLPADLRRLVDQVAAGAGRAAASGPDGDHRGPASDPADATDEPVGTRRDRRGRGRRPGIDRKVIIRIDAAALHRGHAEPGEVCDIAGVGPVPVDAVRRLLPDAAVATVITDGHDVVNVAHLGRRPTAYQRTALEWQLDECCTLGCQNRARCEIDHDDPWAATLHTWLPGLNRACSACHRRKTHERWAFVGEPDAYGKRPLVPPDDPRHPDHTGERPRTPAERQRTAGGRRGPTPAPGAAPPVPDELPLTA